MSDQYKEAGVSLEAGYDSVRRIKSHVDRTRVKGTMDSIGAFGGMFDLEQAGLRIRFLSVEPMESEPN